MVMVMALALGLAFKMYSPPPKWTVARHYRANGWDLRVRRDRFSGTVACVIRRKNVHFDRDTLIFKMGRNAETADAHFRVDGGAVHDVREVLALDEARGFFPDRGWIEDASESEVALPASYALGARTIWIRANSRVNPRYFKVAGLDYILRAAAGQGCTLGSSLRASDRGVRGDAQAPRRAFADDLGQDGDRHLPRGLAADIEANRRA